MERPWRRTDRRRNVKGWTLMCTGMRFVDTDGRMFFGRNLDWTFDYGERVLVIPRGFEPASPFGATTRCKHALIGMGIVEEGQPLLFDAGNDAGLAVAGLNFPGYAAYEPAPVEGKANVAAWEFPLWVAANFATVDEVAEALADAVVVDEPIAPKWPSSLLHWIVGDANRSIVVEYTSAGMQVFDNPVDVLANQPGYGWHAENLRNYLNVSSDFEAAGSFGAPLAPFGAGASQRGLPGDYSSPSRFVRAAYVNANYPAKEGEPANVSRLFHSLSQVAMVEGGAMAHDGRSEKTLYTSCFSASTGGYYFNTYDDVTILSYHLGDYPQEGDRVIEA